MLKVFNARSGARDTDQCVEKAGNVPTRLVSPLKRGQNLQEIGGKSASMKKAMKA